MEFLNYKFNVLVQDFITKHHRLNGLNNRHLFFTVPKVGSPKSRCQQILSDEGSLPGLQMAVSSYERVKDRLSHIFSYKGTNPTHRHSTFMT